LGPGEYELALLGRPDDLRGRVLGSPGRFTVDAERPLAALAPIRVERDVLPAGQAFSPSGLPEAPEPVVPEPPGPWKR
jgi:hypothetical protein